MPARDAAVAGWVTLAPESERPKMTITVSRLKISGIVQGVGYRWAMVQAARRLGVTGWVRNRHDGSVEAMVAGTPEAVADIVAWARQGPRSAVVRAVEALPGEGHFESFEEAPSA
jgi:acylphosphatase